MLKKLTGSNIVLASGVVILFTGLIAANLLVMGLGLGISALSYMAGGY